MHSSEAKLDREAPVLDDPRESEKVASRARLRVAELLRKPFDVRSIALTGLFILAIFYTMYFIRSVLLPVVLAVILLYFLLVYDGVFMAKLIKLMPTLSDKKTAVSIAHDIESHVSRYLLTVTIINTCLGVAVGTTVGLLGLRNPVMWGVMVAVLNFVPYVGALTGIICMTVGAVLSFGSFGYALLFPAVYLPYGTLVGNLVTPWLMC